jgi:hypothetical protein
VAKKQPPKTNRSTDEARENGKKGGIASGIARKQKKTASEILAMLDNLPVKGNNKTVLADLGIPETEHTQHTLRMVALHKKALSGDVKANQLLLELNKQMPNRGVDITVRQPNKELLEIVDCLQEDNESE